jgi:hypothetical protein
MLKKISMISLGAAIVLAPLTALAASAPPAGSHKSQTRHTSNMKGERAQTSAKHMHHIRHPGQP